MQLGREDSRFPAVALPQYEGHSQKQQVVTSPFPSSAHAVIPRRTRVATPGFGSFMTQSRPTAGTLPQSFERIHEGHIDFYSRNSQGIRRVPRIDPFKQHWEEYHEGGERIAKRMSSGSMLSSRRFILPPTSRNLPAGATRLVESESLGNVAFGSKSPEGRLNFGSNLSNDSIAARLPQNMIGIPLSATKIAPMPHPASRTSRTGKRFVERVSVISFEDPMRTTKVLPDAEEFLRESIMDIKPPSAAASLGSGFSFPIESPMVNEGEVKTEIDLKKKSNRKKAVGLGLCCWPFLLLLVLALAVVGFTFVYVAYFSKDEKSAAEEIVPFPADVAQRYPQGSSRAVPSW